MRDLLVFAIVMLMLPGSFRQPFVGLLLFSWLAYMRPQDLCWGFARTMRLSFFVGMAMVAGWWANEAGKRAFAQWDFRTRAMLALGLLVTISYAFARQHDDYTNRYFAEYLKIILVALFTTGQVDSPARFRTMLWTIALCLAFFGVKGGVFGVLGGGSQILRGPGGMMEDNNDFALALTMNVPLLWYLGLAERGRKWVWLGTRVAVLLTVITIVLTHSRGAFLALTAATLWIAWRSGKLFRAGMALVAIGCLFLMLAPAEVLERIASIGDKEDSSINARFVAWAAAFRMIETYPLFGVGMRNFQTSYLEFSGLDPSTTSKTYVAHNSYLQIWAESGTLAFVVYLVLLASVFVACRKVYQIGRLRPDLEWCRHYARMMEATTLGFMVGAFFLNRGHFDLIYHWLALVTCLFSAALLAYRQAPGAQGLFGGTLAAAQGITVRVRERFGRPPAVAVAGADPTVPAPPSDRLAVGTRVPRWGRRR